MKIGTQSAKQTPDFVGGYYKDNILLLGKINQVYCYLFPANELKFSKSPLFPLMQTNKVYLEYQQINVKVKVKSEEKVSANEWQEGYESNELKHFIKFNEEISGNPYQLIRIGTKPLYFSQKQVLDCPKCRTKMDFAFQFMPYLLDLVVYKGLDMQEMLEAIEFGTVLIFKCKCEFIAGIVQTE